MFRPRPCELLLETFPCVAWFTRRDLSKNDVDRMQARGLYQGTIWQYRWFVPWDVNGLQDLTGGAEAFEGQLDQFFEEF